MEAAAGNLHGHLKGVYALPLPQLHTAGEKAHSMPGEAHLAGACSWPSSETLWLHYSLPKPKSVSLPQAGWASSSAQQRQTLLCAAMSRGPFPGSAVAQLPRRFPSHFLRTGDSWDFLEKENSYSLTMKTDGLLSVSCGSGPGSAQGL